MSLNALVCTTVLSAGVAVFCCSGLVRFAEGQGAGETAAQVSASNEALANGAAAMRGGDMAQAVASFQLATQMRPRFAEGYLNLGLALEQQRKYPEAISALDKARTLKPMLHGVNLFLGIAEYQTGVMEKAEEALQREVKLSSADASARMWLGITQEARGKVEAAAKTLDEAASLAPKDTDILYHRGRVHLLVSKASYERMFALDPESYRVHEVLGQADAEADRTSDAIGEYKLAVERAPQHEGLHEELGDLYWTAGKMDLADEAYRQELSIDPYSSTANYKLGSLRVIVGKPQEALEPLQEAVKLEPSFESAYYYLGRAEVDSGQDALGLSYLQRASTAPGDTTLNTLAFYQLSRAYRRLHRTAEANAALAQFRALRDATDKQQAAKRDIAIGKHRQLPRQEQIPSDDSPGPL